MTLAASSGCGPITDGTPGFRMPAFSAAIAATVSPRNARRASETGAIAGTSGRRATMGGASLPPSPDPGEGENRCRRRDLEQGDRRARVGPFAFLEQREQGILLDQLPGQADALVKPHEMRRGVDMDAVSGGFEAGAQGRDRRTLAVGPGEVDRRRQSVVRIAERAKQALDPAEREVDLLRVE